MSELDINNKTSSNIESFSIHSDTMPINEKSNVQLSLESPDTIQTIANQTKNKEVTDCEQPTLAMPDLEKVTGFNQQQAIQEIKSNVWLEVSFLTAFTEIVNDLLDVQREMHLNEAMTELETRSHLYDLAKTSGALAKALANNQAQEQMVVAISSFANAAVSASQFMQTARNMGKAKNEIDQEIEAKKDELTTLRSTNPQPSTNLRERSKNIRFLENELKDMKETRFRRISERTQNLDQQTQLLNSAQEKAINGMAAVLNARIKIDTGVKEEAQKLNEGFMQVMNKYNETSSKARDDAAATFSRFLDFMNKLIESGFKAHYLSGRA